MTYCREATFRHIEAIEQKITLAKTMGLTARISFATDEVRMLLGAMRETVLHSDIARAQANATKWRWAFAWFVAGAAFWSVVR